MTPTSAASPRARLRHRVGAGAARRRARPRSRRTAVAPYATGRSCAGSRAAARGSPSRSPPTCGAPGPRRLAARRRPTRSRRRADGDGGGDRARSAGIGVDFTSCTVLPAPRDGTPLVRDRAAPADPHAWPKLWKHHGAARQAERLTTVAVERGEPWLDRYGGVVGLEWFFPKILEVVEADPAVADAAEVWLEARRLAGLAAHRRTVARRRSRRRRPRPLDLPGRLQGLWSPRRRLPVRPTTSTACHPDLVDVVDERLPGALRRARRAGRRRCPPRPPRASGSTAGTPVSAAVIDAHAGVPGAGVGEPARWSWCWARAAAT